MYLLTATPSTDAKYALWLTRTGLIPASSSTRAAAGRSSRLSPRPARPAGRKQLTPVRRSAGVQFYHRGYRGTAAAAAGAVPPVCLRRLGRRPCRAARPAATVQPPAPAAAVPLSTGTPTRRAARLADTVRRLAERRELRAAIHGQRSVTRPVTPRKRSQTAAARTPRATPRPSHASSAAATAVGAAGTGVAGSGAANRQSTVHSIDSLLSTQSRTAPPPPPQPATPPVVVPTPMRPSPYAAYAAYLAAGGGGGGVELCAVPPPAGCAPLPQLLLSRLNAPVGGGGLIMPVQGRPSPAHSASGWYPTAIDYSQPVDG